MKVGDAVGHLGFDFGWQIFDTELGRESVRLIKIQCPGVEHADVQVGLLFNGCEITVRRRASRGVEATTWSRQFQFRISDGLFEFREDQMKLEKGFLQLVFRAYSFQSRVIRFPQHFSLVDTDADHNWEYAADHDDHDDEDDARCDPGASDGAHERGDDASKRKLSQPDDSVSTASTLAASR